jgi:hypothetical protein
VTSSDASVLALIAIVGTVITALFKLLNDNTKALGQLVDSNAKIAQATERGAREAKERNGHLGEQSIQIATLVRDQNKDVSEIKGIQHEIAATNTDIKHILQASAVTLTHTESNKTEAAGKVRDALIDKE